MKSRTASVNTDNQCRKQESCFARATLLWLAYVRSVSHGPVSLAAANQIYVFYEAMNGCKHLKIQ